MKKKLVSLIQLAIGLGVIAFIFISLHRQGKIGALLEAIKAATSRWPFLLVGFLLFFICLLFCMFRWRILLKSQGVKLPLSRIATLTFIGHFFNSFLFGATGGDVFKAYFVARETHHRKTEVVSTVFIDRMIGMIALILLSVMVMTVRLRFFLAHEQTRMALFFNAILLCGTTMGLLLIFRRNLFEQFKFFRRIEERTAVGKIISKAYKSFHSCLNQPRVVIQTILLSICNHITLVVCVYFIGRALNINMPFINYLTVFPIINAIACIPITPGGLGTREGASIYLLGAFNVPEENAFLLSLLIYTAVLAWSLIGGVVYLVFAYRQGIKVNEISEMEQDALDN